MTKQKQPCGFIEFYAPTNRVSGAVINCYKTGVLPIEIFKEVLSGTNSKKYFKTIAVLKIYLK